MEEDFARNNLRSADRYKIGYYFYQSYSEAFFETWKLSTISFLIVFIFYSFSTMLWPFLLLLFAYKSMILAFLLHIPICALFCLFYKSTWFYRLRVRVLLAVLLNIMMFAAFIHGAPEL